MFLLGLVLAPCAQNLHTNAPSMLIVSGFMPTMFSTASGAQAGLALKTCVQHVTTAALPAIFFELCTHSIPSSAIHSANCESAFESRASGVHLQVLGQLLRTRSSGQVLDRKTHTFFEVRIKAAAKVPATQCRGGGAAPC